MDQGKQILADEIKKVETEIDKVKGLLPELGEEAEKEITRLEEQKSELEKAMNNESGLPPRDALAGQADDFNSVIIEVRPGVGGTEAKIWADDLLRMYTRYANTQGWKTEEIDEGVLKIRGRSVFSALKNETGVHRVQRVPETEAAGRIHTSTASAVVLPEVPESLVEIRDDDLIWEFTRGGGHGGQNVNKVATAVRLTHEPSGLVVQSRQERSQEQNRKIALALLRSQLWEAEDEKKRQLISDQRSVIGSSMRAEKVRTYNYPQNRVTDHRAGKSWHKLDKIMEGDLQDIIEALHNV